MLATINNLPAEQVQPVPIYCRYIYKRYIFSGPDILPMPIYCRYVSVIALCSFKRIWGAMEYLTPLAPKSSPKSSCQCNGWLGIGCWILFLVWVVAAESKSERWWIEYYSTMHCNEVLQACRVDPIYCDIFGAAERVLRYGLPINLRYIFKRVPALLITHW